MSDGRPTPLALDGMAAFKGPRGTVRLIRNHEDRNVPPARSIEAGPGAYDPAAGGGTTTLDYDPERRRLVRSFVRSKAPRSTAPAASACAAAAG